MSRRRESNPPVRAPCSYTSSRSIDHEPPRSRIADQNVKWACAHGYAVYFLRLVGEGCTHPLWGRRHPSYCKLAAMAHVLSLGHTWSVFLDSDAMIRNANAYSLHDLINRYGG